MKNVYFQQPARLLLRLAAFGALILLIAGLSINPQQASSATAATTIGADITVDTTWTSAGNPYLVTAPIRVTTAATLTIMDGVEVQFAANAGLRVEGGLVATGTQARQVKFVGASGATWQGLAIAQPASNVVLQSVTLRNALAALAIRQQGPGGGKNGGQVDVRDSLFENNVIGLDADYSTTTNAPRLSLRNSLFSKNQIGLQFNGLPNGNLKPKFNHNSFSGNTVSVNALNASGKGLKMQQHWWGSASGPQAGSPSECANPAPPSPAARDLVCGNVDATPWSRVASGRVIVAPGAGVVLESALGQGALSDDDLASTSIMTLTVPAGAFTQAVDLIAAPRDDLPFVPPGQSTQLAFELTAAAGGQEIHQLANGRQLTLEIAYIAADLNGADPSKLKLYYYDETRKTWSTAGIVTSVDPARGRISAQLSHLSRYRVSFADLQTSQIFLPLLRR